MNLHPFPRTSAALSITRKELSTIIRVTSFVVQIVTMIFYGIMMALSYPSLVRMVTYSILFSLSVGIFIIVQILSRKRDDPNDEDAKQKAKRRRNAYMILKICNYLFRLGLIGISLYDIIRGQSSDLAVISTVVSGILFFFGLIIEVIVQLFYHYLDFFSFAIRRDIDEHRFVSSAVEAKNNPFSLIEGITGFFAGKTKEERDAERGKALTPREKELDEMLMDTYRTGKEASSRESIRKWEASKARIKDNLRRIGERLPFKKKKKPNDAQEAPAEESEE